MPLEGFMEIIKESDFWGQHSELFPEATHLLCELKEDIIQPATVSEVRILQPQGFGSHRFAEHEPCSLADRPMTENTAKVFWDLDDVTDGHDGKVLLIRVKEQFPRLNADWTFNKHSRMLIMDTPRNGDVKFLELFSGGVGGWAVGIRFIATHLGIPCRTLAVESDLDVLQYYAVTHDSVLIPAEEKIMKHILAFSNKVAVHAEVYDEALIKPISDWNADIATLSPPCQPFSGAGNEQGLESVQGQAFIEALSRCKLWRIPILLLEQAPGFPRHRHYHWVVRQLKAAGYEIRWQQVVEAAQFCATFRPRWLCMATLNHSQEVQLCPFQPWNQHPTRTPKDMDTILTHDALQVTALRLSPSVVALSSRYDMLPSGSKSQFRPDQPAADIFASRLKDGGQTLPTFMAMYGSQRCLSEEKLKAKGLMSHYHQPADGEARFWHPAEVALHHCAHSTVVLPRKETLAWKIEGNQISPVHALLLLLNALNQLPTRVMSVDVPSIIETFWDNRMTNSNTAVQLGQTFMHVHSTKHPPFNEQQAQAIEELALQVDQFSLPPYMGWHRQVCFFPS